MRHDCESARLSRRRDSAKHNVQLQCSAGQRSLCLARRGARVSRVDFTHREYEHVAVVEEMASTDARFDIVFSNLPSRCGP